MTLHESALAEYDEACARHDAEMESICAAFMANWGKVPLLDTYRQMAIRQQKKKDWALASTPEASAHAAFGVLGRWRGRWSGRA